MNLTSLLLVGFMTEVVAEIGLRLQTSWLMGLSLKNLFLYAFFLYVFLRVAIIRDYDRIRSLGAIHIPFLLFLFLGGISIFLCHAVGNVLRYDLGNVVSSFKGEMLDLYLFFFLYSCMIREKEAAKFLMIAFVWIAIFGGIATVINFCFPQLNFFGFDGESIRPNGFLGEPNQTAAVTSMFMPVVVSLAIDRVGMKRLFYWVGAAILLMTLVATSSRGGMLGTVVGLGLLMWAVRKRMTFSQTLMIFLLGLIFMMIAWFVMPETYRTLLVERWSFMGDKHIDIGHASAGRTYVWAKGIEIWLQSPLFGHGWKSFNPMVGHTSHNSFLEVLFNLGAIGIIVYLILIRGILGVFKQALAVAADRDRILLCGVRAGFFALLVSLFFVNLYRPWFFVWAFIGISACFCSIIIEKTNKGKYEYRNADG